MNQKHGSPTFYALLGEMEITHDKKSHDYASNNKPYGNYEFAGQVACMFSHSPQDAGFAGRLAEKIYRLANLESGGKTPMNENIEDTERDIAVIATLWMAARRDRRNQSNPSMAQVVGGLRLHLDTTPQNTETLSNSYPKAPEGEVEF